MIMMADSALGHGRDDFAVALQIIVRLTAQIGYTSASGNLASKYCPRRVCCFMAPPNRALQLTALRVESSISPRQTF